MGNFYFFLEFLVGRELLYKIVLVSAMHQHESAIGICISDEWGGS